MFTCSIFRLEIVLVIHSGEHSVRVVCSELTHMENYTQPNAPGMTSYCQETEKNQLVVSTCKKDKTC